MQVTMDRDAKAAHVLNVWDVIGGACTRVSGVSAKLSSDEYILVVHTNVTTSIPVDSDQDYSSY